MDKTRVNVCEKRGGGWELPVSDNTTLPIRPKTRDFAMSMDKVQIAKYPTKTVLTLSFVLIAVALTLSKVQEGLLARKIINTKDMGWIGQEPASLSDVLLNVWFWDSVIFCSFLLAIIIIPAIGLLTFMVQLKKTAKQD